MVVVWEELLPCRVVGVECGERGAVRLYAVAEPGVRVGGCTVVYARPTPCIITPYYTLVRRARRRRFRVEELEGNVLIKLEDGSGERLYVYPRSVWERVSAYIEAPSRGRAPPEPGLLLYGPPGTGKTSLARLLAEVLGVHVVELDQSILSKWVGESEANLRAKLDEAEENEPALVIADEGEWLLARRELSGSSGHMIVENNLVNELLRRLQRWKNEGLAVAMVVATNYSVKAVDPAFLRPGRFEAILVPPPDLEAIRALLREMGVERVLGRSGAERMAARLLAAGANMAEVVEAARRVLRGETVRLSGGRSYGYRRIAPLEAPEEGELRRLAELLKCRFCRRGAPSSRGRYVLTAGLFTGIALAAFWLLGHGYTPILAYSRERLEEAVYIAEASRGGLIATPDALDPRLLMDADAPIVVVDPGGLATMSSSMRLARLEVDWSNARLVAHAVRLFYGVELETVPRDERSLEEAIAARLQRLG